MSLYKCEMIPCTVCEVTWLQVQNGALSNDLPQFESMITHDAVHV